MSVKIAEVTDEDKKIRYTDEILRKLPEWFTTVEDVIKWYIEGVAPLPYWSAADTDGNIVGFLSVKLHYGRTGDIFACGILPEYHGKGIGTSLFAVAEAFFRQNGCKYIIVKTLSDTAHFEPYERTRRFYKNVGFEELLTLTEMRDAENPCLIMIKSLA